MGGRAAGAGAAKKGPQVTSLVRLGEVVDDGRGGPGSDDRGQLLARRTPDASQASKRREECAPPARPDSGHIVQFGS